MVKEDKMKKAFIIIYSVIMSLVLIFSITFFAVNIYNEKAHGELRTQVRFSKVTSGVTNALKKSSLVNTETMRLIENTVGDTNDFAFLKINLDSKTIYVYPENAEQQDAQASNLVIPYKYTFTTSDNKKLEINSYMYSLRPSTIHYYAKISFFIILIVALITIILIIFNAQFYKDSDTVKIRTSKKSKNSSSVMKHSEKTSDDEEDYYESSDNENEETDENVIPEDSDEIIDEPEADEDEQPVESAKPEPEKIVAELPVKELEPVELEEESTEKGLFSPDTGIGWESYLMTRLENELNRATASELDLALFIIKLDGLGRKNPLMKKICEYLMMEFQFKDLLFEYKDDSVCGIKISMDIDNAVTFAEKLVEEIKKIAGDEVPVVLAGITTRGIRMVSGERLLKEADEAVKHTDSKNPVVGFRADAVKYRKFIETK